jgi:hypothetical protein
MAADIIATVRVSNSLDLSVHPDPIPCGKRSDHDMDIQWHIETKGWKFMPNGIVFKDNDDETFHDPQPGDSDFHWTNDNHNKRLYHYTVNVISTDGKTTLTYDPAIENRGDQLGS